MIEKFTLEDLLMKIIPGGILIVVLCFLYYPQILCNANPGFDFLYTFIFITFAYLAGEIIQTIAHIDVIERGLICSFFKFYKPSEIFLYKNNPVIKDEKLRQKILGYLKLSTYEVKEFKQEYKELSFYGYGEDIGYKCQTVFDKLYTNVRDNSSIKMFNRGYLMSRGIVCLFYMLSLLLLLKGYEIYGYISISLFFIFLWRSRGMARTLVFRVIMTSLDN